MLRTFNTKSFLKTAIQVMMVFIITGIIIRSSIYSGIQHRIAYQTPFWAIAVHLASVIPAVPLGAYVLWAKKGDERHKLLGRVWAGLMVVTAIDSYWIRDVTGGLSFIHLFSIATLLTIPLAIYYIRTGNVVGHQKAMRGLYIGLCVALVYALTPGRLLGHLLWGF